MYNVEIKNKYLDTRSSEANRKTVSSLLASYEEIESDYHKDLGEFSSEEIVNAMNTIGYPTRKRVTDVLRLLRGYRKWYSQHMGLDGMAWDNIRSEDIEIADTLRSETLKDIDEINVLTAKVPTDQCEMSFPLIYMLWYGIEVGEAIELNTEDVAISENKIAIYTERMGKTVIDNPKAVEVISLYAKTDVVVRMKPNPQRFYKEYTGKFFSKIYTENTTQDKKPITKAYLNSTWCSFRDRYELTGDPKLPSINGVLTSGRMFRLLAEENENGSASDEFIKKEFNFCYENQLSNKKMINNVRRQFKAYKEAFYK